LDGLVGGRGSGGPVVGGAGRCLAGGESRRGGVVRPVRPGGVGRRSIVAGGAFGEWLASWVGGPGGGQLLRDPGVIGCCWGWFYLRRGEALTVWLGRTCAGGAWGWGGGSSGSPLWKRPGGQVGVGKGRPAQGQGGKRCRVEGFGRGRGGAAVLRSIVRSVYPLERGSTAD